MWMVFGAVGLVLGSLLSGVTGAVVFAVLGGLLGRALLGQGTREPQVRRPVVNAPGPMNPADHESVLQAQVQALHQRVTKLESLVAALSTGVVAKADVVAPTATVPVPSVSAPQQPEQVAPPAVIRVDVQQPVPVVVTPSPPTTPPVIVPLEPMPKAPSLAAPPSIPVAPTAAPTRPAVHRQPVPKSLRERLPAPIAAFIYGGNTLVKAGVLILFLGLAFLLRYTAERVTVPVELRYAGVALAGAALLGLGWFLRNRRRDYALILQGAGIGVFYLTGLAAVKLHEPNLLSPEIGFVFLALVSILGATLAVLQNAPVLAVVATVGGFATPVLMSTGSNRPVALFTYLAILDLGIFLMASFKAWRLLNLIGFVGTFTLAAGWAHKYYTHEQYGVAQGFLLLFFAMFTAIGLLYAKRTLAESTIKDDDSLLGQARSALSHVGRVDSALVFGTPLTAFSLQYLLTRPWEFGAAFSALVLGLIYVGLARFVYNHQKPGLSLLAEAYVIIAGIFGTLAIPLGLEGQWTGAAWAVEGAGMYWLGTRQQRPYARGLALLVLAGAAYKLLSVMSINTAPESPLLIGTAIGPMLLAASSLVVWRLCQQCALRETQAAWEAVPAKLTPWLGMAALSLLPWQWLTVPFASAAMALIGLLAQRLELAKPKLQLTPLHAIGTSWLGLAVIAFLASLHGNSGAGDQALASGWSGAIAAAVIAACLLISAGLSMVAARRAAIAQTSPAAWPVPQSVTVVVGVALVHLAMLFGLSWQQAAWVWPMSACLVLAVAMFMAHTPLAILSGVLQLFSAVLFVNTAAELLSFSPFAHRLFGTPLVLSLAAMLSGYLIHREACGIVVRPKGWANTWSANIWVAWLAPSWALLWWLAAWVPEAHRVLIHIAMPQYLAAAAVLVVLGSSVLWASLAKWRRWPVMGSLTGLTLLGYVDAASQTAGLLPSIGGGWLMWPLALAWHLCLLRWQETAQPTWLPKRVLQGIHVLGFWLFVVLATRESALRLDLLGSEGTSWRLLGWALVPALVFWVIRSNILAKRWPQTTWRREYLEWACLPVAVHLAIWVWGSNALSSGHAAPLPYVPVLNPLELAHWLLLAALGLWWLALPATSKVRLPERLAAGFVGLTALALVTGLVLRSVHHYAAVPWASSALFDSRLAQAAVSIVWSVCAVLAMLMGNRKSIRSLWIAGAVLLAVVVAKLFFVELADQGGVYRIVSFIGVGVLLLAVGYFAPVPSVNAKPRNESDHQAQPS